MQFGSFRNWQTAAYYTKYNYLEFFPLSCTEYSYSASARHDIAKTIQMGHDMYCHLSWTCTKYEVLEVLKTWYHVAKNNFIMMKSYIWIYMKKKKNRGPTLVLNLEQIRFGYAHCAVQIERSFKATAPHQYFLWVNRQFVALDIMY